MSITVPHPGCRARATQRWRGPGPGAGEPAGRRTTVGAVPRPRRRPRRRPGRRPRPLHEVALLVALYLGYSASRTLADDDLAAARDRALGVLHLERLLHLDVEATLNHALAPISQVAVPMSFWYASLHYLVTPAVLVFLYLRRPPDYRRARNVLITGSALGLACYVLVPVAPPRLLVGGHYTDVLAQTAGVGWWSDHASAPAGLGQLTNELAAMPSLHVGWALWVAWAIWRHVGVAGRVVASAYVAGTTLVVLATGNHWLLDAVAGALVIAVGVVVTRSGSPGRAVPNLEPWPTHLTSTSTR